MDPIIGGALISGAGSLLGGILNRNSAKSAASQNRKWALQDQAEQFVRLRAAAEKGGFNPLTALGAAPNSGMPNQTQAAQSYVGTAIADSAAMLADGMTKQQLAINAKAEDLARQKAILERKLTEATLRPDQPGIFQRGGNNGSNSGDSGSDDNSGDAYARSFLSGNGLRFGIDVPEQAVISDAASNKGTLPPQTPLYIAGFPVFPSRKNSDAEAAETRYGDLAGTGQGIFALSTDIGWNLGRIVKNGSFDPKYRIDVDPVWGFGSPAMREVRRRGFQKAATMGRGAKNQEY